MRLPAPMTASVWIIWNPFRDQGIYAQPQMLLTAQKGLSDRGPLFRTDRMVSLSRRLLPVQRVSLAIGVALIAAHGGRCADRADLDAAFLATFKQRTPLVRTVSMPVYDTSQPPPR